MEVGDAKAEGCCIQAGKVQNILAHVWVTGIAPGAIHSGGCRNYRRASDTGTVCSSAGISSVSGDSDWHDAFRGNLACVVVRNSDDGRREGRQLE